MHFEDIWNEAESIADKDTSLITEDVLSKIETLIKDIPGKIESPEEQALVIGEILFNLACIVSISQRRAGVSLNVAEAMKRVSALHTTSSQSYIDPEERAEEKEASRRRDVHDLVTGAKTPEELHEENTFLRVAHGKLDYSSHEW